MHSAGSWRVRAARQQSRGPTTRQASTKTRPPKAAMARAGSRDRRASRVLPSAVRTGRFNRVAGGEGPAGEGSGGLTLSRARP
jgi:hypothetical protein